MKTISIGAYTRLRKQLREESEVRAELVRALKHAVECAEYCRRRHDDPQKGDGVPAELLWKEVIAKAEAL